MKIFSNVAIRLFGLAVVGLVGFSTAQAQTDASYSALACTSGWACGYAVGHSSRQNADVTALNQCHSRGRGECHIEHRFRGKGCIALAAGYDGAGGWGAISGYNNNESAAKNEAINRCSRHGNGCSVVRSHCSSN